MIKSCGKLLFDSCYIEVLQKYKYFVNFKD